MSILEIIAVVLGVMSVVLIVRRSLWNYPFGIAMVVLYAIVFAQAKLYGQVGLQVFFAFIQIYGWWNWAKSQQQDGEVAVLMLSPRDRVVTGVLVALGTAGLGWGLRNYTDGSEPYVDAFITAASVAAQVLLSWRRIENWPLWIVVDLVAIGLYVYRGMHLTAGLYVLFLGLAVWGLVEWRRTLRPKAAP